jgi:coenzyme F420-reducing hydrogenase beta subunit
MNRIAVMSYNTGDIDIITLDEEMKTTEEVKDYLQENCNYNLDEIYWMEFDKGKISFLTSDDFYV